MLTPDQPPAASRLVVRGVRQNDRTERPRRRDRDVRIAAARRRLARESIPMTDLAGLRPPSSTWLTGSCGRRSRLSTVRVVREAASSIRTGSGTARNSSAWIATGPTPLKRAHLERTPFVSVNYWSPEQDTCAAECRGNVGFRRRDPSVGLATLQARAGAGRLRPGDRARLEGRPDICGLRRATARSVAAACPARHGDARWWWRSPDLELVIERSSPSSSNCHQADWPASGGDALPISSSSMRASGSAMPALKAWLDSSS